MVFFVEQSDELRLLGKRLRAARLARNEPMEMFARRIGVSVPTLRHMETGVPTVGIGHWTAALWALGRLDDLRAVLASAPGLIEQARLARERTTRQRARTPRRSGAVIRR